MPHKDPEKRKEYQRNYMRKLREKLSLKRKGNVKKTKLERAKELGLEAIGNFPSYEEWKKLPYMRMWKDVTVEAYKLQKLEFLERREKMKKLAKTHDKKGGFDEASFPWARYSVDLWKGSEKKKLTDKDYQNLMSEVEEDLRDKNKLTKRSERKTVGNE